MSPSFPRAPRKSLRKRLPGFPAVLRRTELALETTPPTPTRPERPRYDASYKKLFSPSRTVADLLHGFAEDCARGLDLSTLVRLPASFVAEDLGQRHADMLWKVRFTGGTWLYLLVLLEFQSTVVSDMAMRMLDYTVRALRAVGRKDRGPNGEYPPLLPVVVYNGERRWNASTDTLGLFGPASEALVGYLPQHRYLLLDVGSLDPSGLPPDNAVSAIARLEQARSMGELAELGLAVGDWLRQAGETELLGAFRAWIEQVLVQRELAGDRTAELRIGDEEDGTVSMLLERAKKWGDELNREWLEKGLRKGRREGIRRQRALVLRQAALKFGRETASRLAPVLDGLSDPERIAAVADAVIECGTDEEFIRRARVV